MSKDINTDECKDLEKQEKGLECRIKKLEDEMGNLVEQQKETNKILKEGFEAVCNSLKEVVGDQRHAKELDEVLKKQKQERKD